MPEITKYKAKMVFNVRYSEDPAQAESEEGKHQLEMFTEDNIYIKILSKY